MPISFPPGAPISTLVPVEDYPCPSQGIRCGCVQWETPRHFQTVATFLLIVHSELVQVTQNGFEIKKPKQEKGKILFCPTLSWWCWCSVTQSCLTLWPHGLQQARSPVPQHLPKFVQVQVHCVSDAIQPSHLLMPSSPSALNFSQHRDWTPVSPSQMTKILELQIQHQSFQ